MSQQISSQKTSILNKSREIILDLLREQEYAVDDYENFSMSDIHAMMINNQMDMLVSHKSASKKVYVKYYVDGKPMRPATLVGIIEDLFSAASDSDEPAVLSAESDTLVVILNDEPNYALTTQMKYQFDTNGIFVVGINIARLQFNILKHELVPPHRILSAEETEKLKRDYNIRKLDLLPQISRFDPVALAIFIRPGQVCHIKRDSSSAVLTDFYRYCV